MRDHDLKPLSDDFSLAAGTRIRGKYEIERLLGCGGVGRVYLARHIQLSIPLAIKVIRRELARSDAGDMLLREAIALMAIQHDAVVRYQDLITAEDGHLCLVMEFVDGLSLKEILRTRKLEPAEGRALLKRVASGLAAAHLRDVIHCDISPANILLPGGRPEEAKLIDFGIAVIFHLNAKTVPGEFRGNMAYASPEQFGLFGDNIGPASDIFSLGLTIAEAVTGSQIGMANSVLAAQQLRKTTLRLPSKFPRKLKADVKRMLELNPERRLQKVTSLSLSGQASVAFPPEKGWLVAVLYSASAIGVGFGLGVMFWLFQR